MEGSRLYHTAEAGKPSLRGDVLETALPPSFKREDNTTYLTISSDEPCEGMIVIMFTGVVAGCTQIKVLTLSTHPAYTGYTRLSAAVTYYVRVSHSCISQATAPIHD